MIERAADPKEDDGVRDLIHETLLKLWFDTESEGPSHSYSSGQASHLKGKAVSSAYATAQQMVDVVKYSRRLEYVSSLIKQLLCGFSEHGKATKFGERKRKQAVAEKRCAVVVSSLIEILISFEEERSDNANVDARATFSNGEHLVALIGVVRVFAEAVPNLVMHHVDTLLPYLKADNGVRDEHESSIVLNVSKTLSSLAVYLPSSFVTRINDGALMDDLTQIAYKFGSNTVSAAIEVLAKLAARGDANSESVPKTKLLKLAITFYAYLVKMRDTICAFTNTPPKIISNLHRSLLALSSVCRFQTVGTISPSHYTTSCEIEKLSIVPPHCLTWHNLSTASYAVFEYFLTKTDIGILTRSMAVRAMTGVFLSSPRILLAAEQQGVLTDIMSDASDPDVQIAALCCWQDILLTEESRLETGEAKRQMESRDGVTISSKISGDQDGDASLFGSCCSLKRGVRVA